jgi:hypothetical protein
MIEVDELNGWYITHCAKCDVCFAITKRQETRRREDGATFYCPNGHTLSFKGTHEQVRRERDQLRQRVAMLIEEKGQAEAKVLKLQRRSAAGLCQCCNRTFANLQRHMKTKHPNVVALDKKKA